MLYLISVKATTDGFDIRVRELATLGLLDGYSSVPFKPSNLDKINKSRLYSYEPELSVYTYDKDAIKEYISEMKESIRSYLNQRLEYTDYLLDVCR